MKDLQVNFPEYMTLSELKISLRKAWEVIPTTLCKTY
jgi:hypothetical protein